MKNKKIVINYACYCSTTMLTSNRGPKILFGPPLKKQFLILATQTFREHIILRSIVYNLISILRLLLPVAIFLHKIVWSLVHKKVNDCIYCLVHNYTDMILISTGKFKLFCDPEWQISRPKFGSRTAVCGPLTSKTTNEEGRQCRPSSFCRVRRAMPPLSGIRAYRYQSLSRCITCQDVWIQQSHAAKRLIS